MVDSYGKLVGKYTVRPMDAMGMVFRMIHGARIPDGFPTDPWFMKTSGAKLLRTRKKSSCPKNHGPSYRGV